MPARSVSMFRQIALSIEDAIVNGAHPPGSRLPSEAEFCSRFGVSRHTVREALEELRQKGLIDRKQGIGSIVRRATPTTRHVETYSSINELTRHAQGIPIRVHRIDDVIADDELAEVLKCGSGQSFVRIDGCRYDILRPDQPLGHVVVHVDAAYGRIRDAAWNLDRSIVETLEKLYGLRVSRIVQEVTVTALSAELALRLDAEPHSPALFIRRRYLTEAGRIFECADSTFPMGRFVFRTELTN